MERRAIIILLTAYLISFSLLFAEESKNLPCEDSLQTKSSLSNDKGFSLVSDYLDWIFDTDKNTAPQCNKALTLFNYPLRINERTIPFNLEIESPGIFSLKAPFETKPTQKNKKKYFKAAIEMTSLNVTMWLFNRYVIKEKWAYVSLDSICSNLKSGFSWDKDTYWTNLLGHPVHGGINYAIARSNNLSVLESTLYSFIGSIEWDIFLESRGDKDNPPSRNDLIVNTLGGLTLGELLFNSANLFIDESSVGFERVLRETLAFAVNPGNIFRIISGDAFRRGLPPEKHYFNLKIPFGAYKIKTGQPTFLLALDLEYKDYLKGETPSIHAYDWFSLNLNIGFQDYKFRDKEILTTGILTGRKFRGGFAGLFGVFDYINTQAIDLLSALGVGPGLVTVSEFDSDYYFNSSGILYLIMGGARPSTDSTGTYFGTKINDPYYFGPGMLGRVMFELGKKGLGSIDTGFSQYWVHSIFTSADEFRGILILKLKCDLSKRSQISVGYDYYLRHASFEAERFKSTKPAVRAMYVLKF